VQTGQRLSHAVPPLPLPAEAAAAEHPPLPAAPCADEGARLRAASQELIERTLAACGGNVSRAARELGVSRGLIYRHLKPAAEAR
jgi:transcriptional regulator of acetoin/glycerol metabolism